MTIKYLTKRGAKCTLKTNEKQGAEYLAILIINKMTIREARV